MGELRAIVHDVISGALPVVLVPSLVMYLIKTRRRVKVSYMTRDGVVTKDIPVVGEVDSKTGNIKMF